MIRRGSWVPLLPPAARYIVIGLVPLEPIGRGYDYVTPGAENAASLSLVEELFPLSVWGVGCLVAGIVAFVGLNMRWPVPAILGLFLAGCVEATLAGGQWAAVAGVPWLDGIRGPIITSIFALAQFGMAAGYFQQALNDRDAREAPHAGKQ
ncbi:hypothetical protein [Tsukamurella pseudospumae]|uniref:DoxX family protein n=1 Tax=Tsukamurella pseudospumae TaxID=239498 RepID=A0A137ZRZ2_9ACTN|nr:hypothetical protein [Tsukamurella pseudospumae]KXP00919.1 hypothetical protein AXK61_12995 [Tsukamurella pseudospumae]